MCLSVASLLCQQNEEREGCYTRRGEIDILSEESQKRGVADLFFFFISFVCHRVLYS